MDLEREVVKEDRGIRKEREEASEGGERERGGEWPVSCFSLISGHHGDITVRQEDRDTSPPCLSVILLFLTFITHSDHPDRLMDGGNVAANLTLF